MKEVAKAVGENKEIWKRVEKIKVRGRQPDAGLMHPCRQKKKVAWRVVDKVRNFWRRRETTSWNRVVGRIGF